MNVYLILEIQTAVDIECKFTMYHLWGRYKGCDIF